MIFDDIGQSKSDDARPAESAPRSRRSQRRRDAENAGRSGRRRRRRPSSESVPRFEGVVKRPERRVSNGSHVAWLWVLGLLIAAVFGFSWFLHQERSAPYPLPGEAPSTTLLPFIDPILAPLETGATIYESATLGQVATLFRAGRNEVNLDDQEIFSTAITISEILSEALEDRRRHIERLLRLGSPVEGAAIDPAEVRQDLSESERKHLELAVGISWQRNSVAYRNRVEELWYRLLRLEQGRFREGSAPQSMMPALPQAQPRHE